MATILLQAAGGALGTLVGGPFGAVVGRAIGALGVTGKNGWQKPQSAGIAREGAVKL